MAKIQNLFELKKEEKFVRKFHGSQEREYLKKSGDKWVGSE